MGEDACSSPARRLSQLFAEYGGSAPGSPRLPARRSRVYQPPPPPYPGPDPGPSHHHHQSFDRLQSNFPPVNHYQNLGQAFDQLPPPPHPAPSVPPSAAALGLMLDRLHSVEAPVVEAVKRDAASWQERCNQMQMELDRFKTQASRVRDALTDKLSELEQRVLDAECRAELAEDKVRGMMGDRLGLASESSSSEQQAVTVVAKGPTAVIDKLETQVEEQRQLRLADARQVEAKAAKIKEWVTNKLRELEEQNQVLREQNQKCNAQLELLRNHLAHSSSSVANLSRPSPRPLSQAASVGSLGVTEAVYAEVERRRSHRRHQSSTGMELAQPDTTTRDSALIAAADAMSADLEAAVESLALSLPRSVRLIEETTHDYAEIYTPSREKQPWETGKPPTPPLHRFPSWESRIYQVAADGLQLACGPNLVENGQCSNDAGGGYCDISVPVYATVKGRASQIRSMPFTGDSSDDSSDGEDHHGLQLSAGDTRATNSSSEDHQPALRVISSSDSDKGGGLTNRSSDNTSSGSLSPSKSMKTNSSLSPAKRRASLSPSKSVKRELSFESGLSDDYAIPPDALSCDTTASVGSSLLCRVSSITTETNPRTRTLDGPVSDLEKSGHLAKLGGKLKTWRKRYFVLRNGVLTFWKSQSDVHRKPQGEVALNEACRINRAVGAATFEINTGKKVYYLTADSIATMEDWIRVLQNVQRRNATRLLLSKEDNRPTISGWITKVKNGHAKKCWCVLIGKMFLYYKSPSDNNPVGQINMRDARAEEVDHVSDSDSEDRETDSSELTIGVFPNHASPTYLLLASKQDKDQWLYHLTVVSGGAASAQGTHFEQLVQKLMETDGDASCVLWRHPLLLHSKECILSPMTTLHSEALQQEAIKLFKSCQLFMSVQLDSAGIDYHVVLAQNALAQCLATPELQSELICALVKQTSRQTPNTRTTGVQAVPPADNKTSPPSFTLVQGWQMLALAVSLFLPRNNRLLWFLRLHLTRNTDAKTECGKYAAYCSRALERTLINGGRETKPSRMEVLSILLKNPYHHSLPHAIPVHMLNGAYQVVSFDGSTTIEEFLSTLNQELGCRESALSGFTLFSDDPIEKELEHYLDPNAKLCDVISKWETALREKGSGKFENSRVIQLTFKNRLYWRHGIKSETDRERLLLCYQINQQVVLGRFPVSRELAQELAALMSQIDFGEYNCEKARGSGGTNPGLQALHALDKFFPYRYREGITQEELKELEVCLQERWTALKGRSQLDCVRIYLTCARKWPLFGATLFQTTRKAPPFVTTKAVGQVAPGLLKAPCVVWLAVAEEGLSLLELGAMATVTKVPYSSVVTFGGCQDDFMLVASQEGGPSQKMIFALAKPKVLEVTLLIADYMNALGHAVPPGTPLMGSLQRARTFPRTVTAATQPDILKSTPDHQLTRTDSKKRGHLDSGVA